MRTPICHTSAFKILSSNLYPEILQILVYDVKCNIHHIHSYNITKSTLKEEAEETQ
jgi:hypothetical protein